MNVTYRTDGQILYIAMEGKIDTTNAPAMEEKIMAIKKENPGKHTVLDAEHLEYISSAGLRVILRLRKAEPKLAIINVASDVYEIFQMTGFTDMMLIEKAYPQMSVEGCEFIAKGANGAVYRYDDETIVKTYFSKDALPEIKLERENARRAFVLGVNTAIPYGIVRVGDGYGTVTELLKAVSVTKLIERDPGDFSQAARLYIDMLKSIHAIELQDGEMADMKETALGWTDFVAKDLPIEQGKKLFALIDGIPRRNTLLHGDYHSNNVLVQNGEALLIDLETLCMGHPVFELGSMFNAYVGFSELEHRNSLDFLGISFETAVKFWRLALKLYLGTDDEAVCDSVEEKAKVIGYLRLLRRSLRRPDEGESPARIRHCKEQLAILLEKLDTLDF